MPGRFEARRCPTSAAYGCVDGGGSGRALSTSMLAPDMGACQSFATTVPCSIPRRGQPAPAVRTSLHPSVGQLEDETERLDERSTVHRAGHGHLEAGPVNPVQGCGNDEFRPQHRGEVVEEPGCGLESPLRTGEPGNRHVERHIRENAR